MNLIQIAETFCQSSCVFEDVIEALEVLSDFDTTLEAVTSMADGMDIEGCNVWQMQRNFTIDFSPSSTVPKITSVDWSRARFSCGLLRTAPGSQPCCAVCCALLAYDGGCSNESGHGGSQRMCAHAARGH